MTGRLDGLPLAELLDDLPLAELLDDAGGVCRMESSCELRRPATNEDELVVTET